MVQYHQIPSYFCLKPLFRQNLSNLDIYLSELSLFFQIQWDALTAKDTGIQTQDVTNQEGVDSVDLKTGIILILGHVLKIHNAHTVASHIQFGPDPVKHW